MVESIEAALRIAARAKFASGGGIPIDAKNVAEMVTGGLHSAVPGRTDNLPITVPEGCFVIPADVVSALGEGNTSAGFALLDKMFQTRGLNEGSPGKAIPIAAAGGEWICPPDVVLKLGQGNEKQGHAVLDAFVLGVRKKHIATLKGLKPPVKG